MAIEQEGTLEDARSRNFGKNVKFELPEIQEIIHPSTGIRRCDNWLDTYMRYTECTEPAKIIHEAVAYWTLSASLGRRVWLDGGSGATWPLNVMLLIVSPAGVARKSSALNLGKDLLSAAQVKLGHATSTFAAMFKDVQMAIEEIIMPDGTKYHSSPYPLAVDEISTLFDFDDIQMMTHLTQMYDSKHGRISRNTLAHEAEFMYAPCVTLCGCTTDAFMKEHVGAFARGSGVISRTIVIYNEVRYQLVPMPSAHPMYEICQKLFQPLAEDLNYFKDNLRGRMVLTKEALEFNNDWYIDHYTKEAQDVRNGIPVEGTSSRIQANMCKIAGLRSIAEGDSLMVGVDHLKVALDFATRCQLSAKDVMEIRNTDPVIGQFDMLTKFLLGQPQGATKEEVSRALMRHMSVLKIDEYLTKAHKMGVLIACKKGGKVAYKLEPLLKEQLQMEQRKCQ